jgi:protein phosphatase
MSASSPEPEGPKADDTLSLQRPGDAAEPSAGKAAEEEILPGWDALPDGSSAGFPVALPVDFDPESTELIPLALPVDPKATIPPPADDLPLLEAAVPEPPAGASRHATVCRICGSPRAAGQPSCADCGYYFTSEDTAGDDKRSASPAVRVGGRYELTKMLLRRGNVARYRAIDHAAASGPAAVVILAERTAPDAAKEPSGEETSAEYPVALPEDEANSSHSTIVLSLAAARPGVDWERALLKRADDPALPRILDEFKDDGVSYLVEESPAGRPLWDAWDDSAANDEQRFGWLIEIVAALHGLHCIGAIFEGLRPDNFVIDVAGHARFRELTDLLPLPVPPDTRLRGSLYAAPELLTGNVDARADLYAFGAMLYALHVGRELDEADFDRPGYPKPFVPRFPDVHPAFGRLMSKTFRREVEARFPTDEAVREDATGFIELLRTLKVLRRTLANVRLEIAAWTTTGMMRTGNEDAFAVMYSCETRQDDLGEAALVLLTDGMGGYEAGEVAAALTIQVMRQCLVAQPIFAPFAGASHFADDALSPAQHANGHGPVPLDIEACKQALRAALREANRQVYAAARSPGSRRRGMGCTAEAVYVNGRHVIVGHIGDSRTYHLHEGRLLQLTRDQTLVNRLVELGTLTEEEALNHPRRNELQQAVGGQPDVEPALYHSPLSPGDWVVVCSDGLSNHVGAADLIQMLQSEALSAEMAARRLVNLANIEGAADNATVVVVRAT